ncbi:MAG: RNA-binding protein [Pseudomonadota bacterium]
MSNTKIYVGNLPLDCTEEDLRGNFGDLGKCVSAKIIRDKETGVSRGYAFVEMATEQEAQTAIRKCKGVDLDGNKLIVREARDKTEKSSGRKPGSGFSGRKRF